MYVLSDIWYLTEYIWHRTYGILHMKSDIWHLSYWKYCHLSPDHLSMQLQLRTFGDSTVGSLVIDKVKIVLFSLLNTNKQNPFKFGWFSRKPFGLDNASSLSNNKLHWGDRQTENTTYRLNGPRGRFSKNIWLQKKTCNVSLVICSFYNLGCSS